MSFRDMYRIINHRVPFALALVSMLGGLFLLDSSASAASFFFTTGDPDGKVATLSRPASAGKLQTETADDFTLPTTMVINQATFTGLLLGGSAANITDVEIEIYHLFPRDTDPANTNVPNAVVPTRSGSPADVEIDDATRDGLDGTLSFTVSSLSSSFTASNSVRNGIHSKPNQTTLGEGAVTGEEVLLTVTFNPPIALPADHYFFRPEVQLSSGDFLWLSAPKTIPAPADLQTWMRNDATPDVGGIFPNWLRIGADIIGTGAFNAAFSLSGETDEDGDGVADSLDQCPGTPAGAIVDANGCSIDQLAPCAGPASGGAWKNHGEYVSSVAHAVEEFLEQGLITEDQAEAIVSEAARSKCGAKSR